MRCTPENLAQGEEESDIDSLLVAFDARKRRHTDLGALGNIIQ